jgi:hypoxanthine phosphoribosyltransferase
MAQTVNNKTYLSWDDITILIDKLCGRIIEDLPLIDSIYGIPRGGLIPAVLISHKLELPYVNSIGKNTLVVDDICDSGVTLKNSPGIYTAVLYQKPETSCFTPSVWADLHLGNEWLLFPWERIDSKEMQDYLAK